MDRETEVIIGRRSAYRELAAMLTDIEGGCLNHRRATLGVAPDALMPAREYLILQRQRQTLTALELFCRERAEAVSLTEAVPSLFETLAFLDPSIGVLPPQSITMICNRAEAGEYLTELNAEADIRAAFFEEFGTVLKFYRAFMRTGVFSGAAENESLDLLEERLHLAVQTPEGALDNARPGPEAALFLHLAANIRSRGHEAEVLHGALERMGGESSPPARLAYAFSLHAATMLDLMASYGEANMLEDFMMPDSIRDEDRMRAARPPEPPIVVRRFLSHYVNMVFAEGPDDLGAFRQPEFAAAFVGLIEGLEADYPHPEAPRAAPLDKMRECLDRPPPSPQGDGQGHEKGRGRGPSPG